MGAGIITAVALWTPPLYEQFTAPRGNLGMFVHGALSPSTPHVSASLGPGVAAIVSVIAVPPFWLPPHFSHIPFDATGGGQPFWVRVASTVMLVIAGFLALRWAHRHDRPAVPRALVIAVGAVGGWLVTWRSNPNVGLPIKYFWGLWPLAAFIWLVLAYTAACAIMARFSDTDRLRPNGVRNLTIAVGCATVVATSLLAVPRRNLCRGVCASSVDPLVPVARDIRKVVAHDLRGRQAVLVPSSLGITDMTAAVQPSLVLGLQDAAVPAVASTPFDARQFAIPLESAARPAATVRLDITHTPLAAPNAKLLGVFSTRPDISPARFAHLDAVVSKWLRHGPSTLEIASRQVRLGESDRVYWFLALGFRASATEDPSSQPLANFIAQLGLVGLQPRSGLLDVPGLSRADVQEWANERARKSVGTFYLYVVPVP
ncbi:MAG: hypothetical protein JST73_11645 [Actinobacteria bacterium]|nr:hypothetical protein [Actinomycetota bacterium]